MAAALRTQGHTQRDRGARSQREIAVRIIRLSHSTSLRPDREVGVRLA